MGKLSDIKEQAPTTDIELGEKASDIDSIELEPLRKMDWAKIDKKLDKNVKVKIMEIQADMEELDIDREDANIDNPEVRKIALKFQERLDDEAQIEMWYHGLKRIDPDLDREQVDYIITHCIEDPAEFQKGTWWLFNGVDITEASEQLAESGGSGKGEEVSTRETTEDEPSTGPE